MIKNFKRKYRVIFFLIFFILLLTIIYLKIQNGPQRYINSIVKKNVINLLKNIEENKIQDVENSIENTRFANDEANIENNMTKKEIVGIQYKNNKWRIIIPKINLNAPILEGTEKDILHRAVGHFKTTSKWNGNVALAAHNRGYKYNYFQEIKKLEIGDLVEYQTKQGIRNYEVISKNKIEETDLSCLEDTKENTLTLITCVRNEPEYRLCIKAKQKNKW